MKAKDVSIHTKMMDTEFYEIMYEDLSNEELLDDLVYQARCKYPNGDDARCMAALKKIIMKRMEGDNNGSK